MNLDDYRADIDRIDRELVEKLEERMHVAEKIAVYKKEHDLPITDELRERALLDKITDMSSPDMALYNRMLWGTLMDMSKDHQRKDHKGDSGDDAEGISGSGRSCVSGRGGSILSGGLRQAVQNA